MNDFTHHADGTERGNHPTPAGRDQLDELFREIRWALEKQRAAGYQYGKYVHQHGGDDVQHPIMRKAREEADELTAAVWAKLYDLAPAFADAIQVLEVARELDKDDER
jgi:hypothetical protein